jgi:hypothetical protein
MAAWLGSGEGCLPGLDCSLLVVFLHGGKS